MSENYKFTIMKELCIEQKAKRYDEALERVKKLQETCDSTAVVGWCEYIFPELKESEDKQHRKWILEYLYDGLRKSDEQFKGQFKAAIAWLEKQGEQNTKQVSIWKHWKDGICGNGEGKPIYLIKNGDTYSISSCLGYECDYIELSELDKLIEDFKKYMED